MSEFEFQLNHGIHTTEQAENRFKSLRRKIKALQRLGEPISIEALAELSTLNRYLVRNRRRDWESNFEHIEYDSKLRKIHLHSILSR